MIARSERLIGVDLLRAVAIIYVIATHLNNICIKAPSAILGFVFGPSGSDGVTVFFVVSGFLITRGIMIREPDIHRMSLRAFYARRIARIQPLLLASIGLGVLMLLSGFDGEPFKARPHAAFDAAFWLSLVTFSFNWLRVAASQYGASQWGLHWDVMWSLAVEEQFYVAACLGHLLVARRRARFLAALLPVIAFCAASRLVAPHVFVNWVFSSFAGFDALGVGVLVALIAPFFGPRLGILAMLLGVVLMLCGVLSPDYNGQGPILVIVGAACAFVLGAQAQNKIFRSAAWKFPARIGELSYEIYLLLHPMVLMALSPVFIVRSTGFGTALVSAVAIAVAVARAVEIKFTRPMNMLVRRCLLRVGNGAAAESAKA